ncbi:SPOR domain-containing protein [Aquabacterium sp.]|jgi:hypothetical protein|uniref:SPOR domain-containing protein n=1 Tax=Aquabacterium TaxID=92793 RepID=UPI001E19B2ED|nr:SPOR domain-containing protein [Aquabacterium sp.]MBT9611581.1 SPOR domain-containing protein [Aquabacterium sp.]|tara:strand:- start:1475 stop:2245 length:771 start_codon:yes stop_codon:yes gene_type:complete
MLRYLVLILLLVNATFLAWSQGWLKPLVGVQPDAQHEPARLQQQRHADRIAVLKGAQADSGGAAASDASTAADAMPDAASAASSAASGAASSAASGAATASATTTGICLQAGPFRSEDMAQVGTALKAQLPADAWSTQAVPISGIWLVYMGPYPDDELYAKKLSELRRIKGLNFEELSAPPALAQGLSLGRYTSLAEAQSGLATVKLRGIRTARIVVLRPQGEMQLVRVAQASQQTQVALSATKLPQGKTFSACRP